MTIYALSYCLHGQPITERFDSMTAGGSVGSGEEDGMSFLDSLPTMADWNATRHATPKSAIPTRMDRAIEKKQAKSEDERKLAAWAKAVKDRDNLRDRMTGRKVKATRLVLDPDAGHAHHIEPRANLDTRYDVRNGLTVSAATHDAIERNKITVVGTRWFVVAGQRHIDCDYPVKFVRMPE